MKRVLFAFLLCVALQAETNPLIRVTTTNQNTAFYSRLEIVSPGIGEKSPRFLWVLINDDGSSATEYRVVVTVDSKAVVDTIVPRTGTQSLASWLMDVEGAVVRVEPHAKIADATEVIAQ